jgi:hypothetical protein
MNGSDLESEFGAATDDLLEMIDSGLDSRNANVLILTGGTNRWQSDAIPENECIIWQLADGFLNELESMGKVNMGDPNTLRDFLSYCMKSFPAKKYGLIMWDHGGGSIAGFGHDEKFNDASMTLLDMKKAFDEAGLAKNKLEFLGFDACLMATVEMAVLASDYAKVLIAAEDLEPGEGWNYFFLSAFNDNPKISGLALGEIIVDSFYDFYVRHNLADEEILTLSVIDLSKVAPVMRAMGRLVNNETTFSCMAIRRAATKTFGEGSPRDNYADMVDIGDMATQLADIYPREANAVLRALKNCVTYNRHNSDVEIFGLSTFYIYGGKSEGVPSLRMYSALQMDYAYTKFLHSFFDGLLHRSGNIIDTRLVLWQPLENENFRMAGLALSSEEENPRWAKINNEHVCLFPLARTATARRYAIPAVVNNQDADIIVVFTQEHFGKILGIRYNSENVFQKGYDPIDIGDEISFYRIEYDFAHMTENWTTGEPFAVEQPLHLTWHPAPHDFKTGRRHTDICNNIIFTPPI